MKEKVGGFLQSTLSLKEILKFVGLIIISKILFSLLPFDVVIGFIVMVLGYIFINRIIRSIKLWFGWAKGTPLAKGTKRTVHRAARIILMSDTEFEAAFCQPQTEAAQQDDHAEQAVPFVPNMPSTACKKTVSSEDAAEIARAYWEDEGGQEAIAAFIFEQQESNPSSHSSVLTEYEESLGIPQDEAVREALRDIMRKSGLAVDLNADGIMTICWAQNSDGSEAGDD